MPRRARKVVLIAGIISLFVHILSLVKISHYRDASNIAFSPPIKLKFADPNALAKAEQKPEPKSKRMLEAPLAKTKPPEDSKFLSSEDHATKVETKTKTRSSQKALDPGLQAFKPQDATKPKPSSAAPEPKSSDKPMLAQKLGNLSFSSLPKRKPRTKYEALLPNSEEEMLSQIAAGYQDLVDEDVRTGERIDMNTTSYRFIGYFTLFRKQIELVWVYPTEAVQRGIQGEVQLEIIIEKSGSVSKIKIIKSSGFNILDTAMVDTIKQAAPFPPLPRAMKRDRLVVTGAFRYILTNYAGG